MIPAVYDFQCYRGATLEKKLHVKNKIGEPVDLTGLEVKSQIRQDKNITNLIDEFVCHIVPENGEITLSLDAEKTAQLQNNNYYYDVKITNGITGNVQYWLQGKIIMQGRVTI